MAAPPTIETIKLAHTARCKLQLAADRPDRNLRFILGHAFTLDKLRLRIAEIQTEIDDDEEEKSIEQPTAPREGARRVSFQGNAITANGVKGRQRSPPPDQFANIEDGDTDSDSGDLDGEEDEEARDDDLSLRRFGSASAQPPQMVEDDSSSEEDENEPKSPPPMTEEELMEVTGGVGNEDMAKAYNKVAGCPCHGHNAPKVDQVWEVPRKTGEHGARLAVVQVAA